MSQYKLIIAYFIDIATQLLGHTEGEKHFFRPHEEFTNFPALSIENYRASLTDNGGDGRFQHRELSFIVVDHLHDTADDDEIDTIYDETENIGLQIINMMFKDGRNRQHKVIVDFNLNSVSWFPVKSKDNYYGHEFACSLLVPHIIPGL